MTPRAALHLSLVLAGLGLAQASYAKINRLAPEGAPLLIPVEVEAQDAETLRLLAGLGMIRAEVKLGLLELDAKRQESAGSHFARAQKDLLPEIAEGLAAVGVADLAPVLKDLEAARGDAVKDAYNAAEVALLHARSSLAPSGEVVLQSVVSLSKAAADRIDPSGVTPVADYQMAWQLLMVARGELDLLARHEDVTIARLARERAMEMDDLILFMPDPNQPAPISFDPRLILDLLDMLQGTAKDA